MADLNLDEFYAKLIKGLQMPGQSGLPELYQLYDQAVAHYEATHILGAEKRVGSPVELADWGQMDLTAADVELEISHEKRPDSAGKRDLDVKPLKTETLKKVQSTSSIGKSAATSVVVKRTSTEASLASKTSVITSATSTSSTATKPTPKPVVKPLFTLIDVDFATATDEIAPEPAKKKLKVQRNNVVASDSESEDESYPGKTVSEKKVKSEVVSADQFAEDAGLACAVCRLVNTSSDNRLVECTECHQLYHQQCHEPKIANASDSRLIWNCAGCAKKLPVAKKSTAPSSTASLVKPNGDPKLKDTKTTASHGSTGILFKRTDLSSKGTTQPSSGSGNSGGLATLAASFLAKSNQKSNQTGTVAKPPITGGGVKLPATTSSAGVVKSSTLGGSSFVQKFPLPSSTIANRLASANSSVIKSTSSLTPTKPTGSSSTPSSSHVVLSVGKKPTMIGGKNTLAASATQMTNANKKVMQLKKLAEKHAAEKRAFKP